MTQATTITGHESTNIPPIHLTGFAQQRWAVKNPPEDPNVTFAGKTVLVTGANAGLGFEAAVKYAQKGCSKLILAVRTASKGEEAKRNILERSGRQHEDFITVLTVDLSTFSSVRSFISELERTVKSTDLHIALLNAGLTHPTFALSTHGYETALQVNVLSTALMAVLLVPILRRTARTSAEPPHLTFVNSYGHTQVNKEWYAGPPFNGDLFAFMNSPEHFDIMKSYCGVKLLGMAVMQHIARSILATDGKPIIIVNSCCPFFCRTELGRNFNFVVRGLMTVQQWFTARSAEEGARTLVGASCLGEESQGKFWHHDVLHPMGDIAKDEKEMEKFWESIGAALEKEAGIGDVEKLLLTG